MVKKSLDELVKVAKFDVSLENVHRYVGYQQDGYSINLIIGKGIKAQLRYLNYEISLKLIEFYLEEVIFSYSEIDGTKQRLKRVLAETKNKFVSETLDEFCNTIQQNASFKQELYSLWDNCLRHTVDTPWQNQPNLSIAPSVIELNISKKYKTKHKRIQKKIDTCLDKIEQIDEQLDHTRALKLMEMVEDLKKKKHFLENELRGLERSPDNLWPKESSGYVELCKKTAMLVRKHIEEPIKQRLKLVPKGIKEFHNDGSRLTKREFENKYNQDHLKNIEKEKNIYERILTSEDLSFEL